MAYDFTDTNLTPATGAEAIFKLKERLKAEGWVVKESSDGSTYSSSSDIVTVPGAGAGGMANNSAWFRIQDPATVRELTVQRGTDNKDWRVKYSAVSKFVGGTPGITETPSAADEELILGAGTDAAPSFVTWFGTDGAYKMQIAVDDATPYPWWFVCYPNGGGDPNAVMVFDPVSNPLAGDGDPLVIYVGIDGDANLEPSTLGAITAGTSNALARGYLDYGEGGEDWVNILAHTYDSVGGGQFCPDNMTANPHSGKDGMLPIVWGRPAGQPAPQGYKGTSRTMRWHGTNRSTPSTLSDAAAGDRFVAGRVSFDWNGSVPAT